MEEQRERELAKKQEEAKKAEAEKKEQMLRQQLLQQQAQKTQPPANQQPTAPATTTQPPVRVESITGQPRTTLQPSTHHGARWKESKDLLAKIASQLTNFQDPLRQELTKVIHLNVGQISAKREQVIKKVRRLKLSTHVYLNRFIQG